MRNETKFKEYMTGLSEIYQKEMSETTASIYWKILEPFEDERCIAAFNRAIAECKWLPKPAELLEFIKGESQPIEERALVIANEIVAHLKAEGAGKFPDLHGDPIAIHLMTRRWPYHSWGAQHVDSESHWWVDRFCEAYRSYSETDKGTFLDAPGEFKKIANGMLEEI